MLPTPAPKISMSVTVNLSSISLLSVCANCLFWAFYIHGFMNGTLVSWVQFFFFTVLLWSSLCSSVCLPLNSSSCVGKQTAVFCSVRNNVIKFPCRYFCDGMLYFFLVLCFGVGFMASVIVSCLFLDFRLELAIVIDRDPPTSASQQLALKTLACFVIFK